MSEYKPAISINEADLLKNAIRTKQRAMLEPDDLLLLKAIEAQQAVVDREEDKLLDLYTKCTHPLAMREVKNEGYSGQHWDRVSAYWTAHKCTMCTKQWHTKQNWESIGGKLGLPDDTGARDT